VKPICIIPARGGSKGVPGKNIREISKIPLIGHVIKDVLNSKIFSHVIVSTENKKIANIAKKYGAEVPFIRPEYLATDDAAMDDVLIHAVKTLYEKKYNFDTFVWRDATTPFIRNIDIKNSIKLLKKSNCLAVCGVYDQHLNPYFNMVEIKKNKFLKLSKQLKKRPSSRQDSPHVYQLNGLYVYDAKKFLQNKKTQFSKCIHYEIPFYSGLMIDTEFEFFIAKSMIEQKYLKSIS